MSLSVNEYTFSGTYEFDLNFALGYDSASDILAEADVVGSESPVEVQFDFLTDSRVLVTSPTLSNGDVVRFVRTVSKTAPAIDVTQPSNLTRENVDKLFRQSMHVMHEILDGRFDAYTELDASLLATVNQTVNGAILASGLLARYKYPLQVQFSGTAVTWPTDNMEADTIEVLVQVNSNPTEQQEILITGTSGVFATVFIEADGSHSVVYGSGVSSGTSFTVSTLNDFGADVNLVVQGSLSDYLEFATPDLDFVDQINNYTCS